MTGFRILGDWGSTRLRLWQVRGDEVVARRDGPGIVSLPRPPAEVLREAIAPWAAEDQPRRITLCGMAGARGGLREAPYVDCPASRSDWICATSNLDLDGMAVRIAAGCATNAFDGAHDVMRGEETQVFGAMVLDPSLGEGRQTLVLPGTHSKWVTLEDGCITGLRTFLTGELFALLQNSSLLSAGGPGGGGNEDGFAAGLDRATTAPVLLGSLFEARAAQLRAGRSAEWARAFLSGLLIGSEIAEMRQEHASAVTIVGDPVLATNYRKALSARRIACRELDGDACVLEGLRLLDADD